MLRVAGSSGRRKTQSDLRETTSVRMSRWLSVNPYPESNSPEMALKPHNDTSAPFCVPSEQ